MRNLSRQFNQKISKNMKNSNLLNKMILRKYYHECRFAGQAI